MIIKNILRRIFQVLKLMENIGVGQGFLYSLKLIFSPKSVISVFVKGIRHPILLRKNTSDSPTFREVFGDMQYRLPTSDRPVFRETHSDVYRFLDVGFVPQIIIDAGANIGLSSVFFANEYPQAKIFAIEPEHSNLLILKKNILPYPNVILYPKAVHNVSGEELFIDSETTEKNIFQTKESRPHDSKHAFQSVKTVSIPDILKEQGLSHIDLLKIDIEGAERELFSSHVEEWLPRVKYLIIEIHDFMKPGCSKSVFSAIVRYNFSTLMQGEGLLFVNNDLL